MADTIEERAHELAHSILADGQGKSCVEMALEALKFERRDALLRVEALIDARLKEEVRSG